MQNENLKQKIKIDTALYDWQSPPVSKKCFHGKEIKKYNKFMKGKKYSQ